MNKLVSNTFIYSIGIIIPQAAAILLLPIYTRYLTIADYGIVNSMQILNSVLAIAFTLSINKSVYRLIYDYKTDDERKAFIGTLSTFVFLVGSVLISLIFLLNNLVVKIYSSIPFYPYFSKSILAAYFSVFSSIPMAYIQIRGEAKYFISLSLTAFILSTIMIIYYVVLRKMGADGYLTGLLYSQVLMAIIFTFYSIKNSNISLNLLHLKKALAFSIPVIPTTISSWVLNLSDRIFIERYFNLREVGIYSLGYKIAGLVLIFSISFKQALDPYFYNIVNTNKENRTNDELSSHLSKIFTFYILIILVIGFALSFFATEIIKIFFPPSYLPARYIIPIISFSYVLSQTSAFYNLSFYQMKETKTPAIITIFSALINIGLNFLLIPLYGIIGAGISTAISFLLDFILRKWYSKRYYKIEFDMRSVFSILVGIVSLYLLSLLITFPVLISIFLKLSVCLAIMGFVLYKYRNVKIIKSLMSTIKIYSSRSRKGEN